MSDLTDAISNLSIQPAAKPASFPTDAPKTPPQTPASSATTARPEASTTAFPSHVRAHFRRAPTDFTGELVRLLDDISQVSQEIATYVSKVTDASSPDADVATRKLYTALCHDGYACMLLERRREEPLTFPDTALNGGYVVMLSCLDTDPESPEQPICGTIFSVYRRLSSPSLPGRLEDLQQQLSRQVAAGYVLYSSATTLYYTMGQGVFSFYLHPVATQYFLQSKTPLTLPHTCADLYADYVRLRADDGFAQAALHVVRANSARVFDNGSLIANFNGATLSGGILIGLDLHLLCEAAPLALLMEQFGGKATDGHGNRILDMAVTDEKVHQHISLCAGPSELVDMIEERGRSDG